MPSTLVDPEGQQRGRSRSVAAAVAALTEGTAPLALADANFDKGEAAEATDKRTARTAGKNHIF